MDDPRGFLRLEGARILPMRSVDHVGQRGHPSPAPEADRQEALKIDVRDEFPLAKIGQHVRPMREGDTEGHAAARPAMVQAENEAGALLRASMHPRAHAERPAMSENKGLGLFLERKARIPHQRSVAKDPKFVHIQSQVEVIAVGGAPLGGAG